MKQDEKTKVMRLLKELSTSIEKTKEDIKNMISIAGLKKRSKTEVDSVNAGVDLDDQLNLFPSQSLIVILVDSSKTQSRKKHCNKVPENIII